MTEEEERALKALESIAASLDTLPDTLESCANRIELKLMEVDENFGNINATLNSIRDSISAKG